MTQHFQKTVDIKAVDEDARTATGAVLVPDELDHQFDFLRPGAIERFHADDPDTGVMHSAFPDDAAELVRHEILDEPETIGGEEFPAGTEVATRKYTDDDLWGLVNDGILNGFSIGGEITKATDHDTVPDDVRVPDDVEHSDEPVTELIDGRVEEISDVDIPAVPRATYKADDLGKNLLEDVDSEAEFVELMVEQRGHDESDARRLYQYLTSVQSKARTPTKRELLAALNVSKQNFPPWPFSEDPSEGFEQCKEDMADEVDDEAAFCAEWMREELGVGPEELARKQESFSDYPDAAAENAQMALDAREATGDPNDCGTDTGWARANQLANRESVSEETVRRMAAFRRHQDNAEMDDDEGRADCGWMMWKAWGGEAGIAWAERTVDQLDDEETDSQRMTDTTNTDEPDDATKWRKFKNWLTNADDADGAEEAVSQKASDEDEDEDDEDDEEMADDKHASDGDTSGDTMTDDDTDKSDQPPEWAKSLIDTVEENSKQIDDLAAREKTATFEIDGEEVELTEKQAREAFGIGESEKALDDGPAWAQDLAKRVEENAERIETISKQSGHSQQLGGAETTSGDTGDEVEAFKASLVGASAGGDGR